MTTGPELDPTAEGDGVRSQARIVGVTLAAGALAVFTASRVLTRRPLWIDEAYSLGATNQLRETIRGTGGTMALYYVLLDGWTAVAGTSVLALRGLSLTLVLVGIVVLSALAHRLLPPAEAALALIVVAVMPAVTGLSRDARSYALVLVLVTGCWAVLARAVDADAAGRTRTARRWCLALAPLVAAGVLSHGLFVLQVPALFLSVAVHLRRRPLVLALVPALVAGAATLIGLLVLGIGQVGNWIPPLGWDQIRHLGTYLLAGRIPVLAATLLLVVIGAATLVRRPAPDPVHRWKALVPVWWAATAPVLLVALSTVRPSVMGRYVSGSVPALAILIAVGLHALWRTVLPDGARTCSWPRVGIAVVLVAAAISLPIVERRPRPQVSFEDWDAVADHIGSRARPGDGIAFMPIGGELDNPDLLRAPFEAAWTERPGPRVELVAVSPERPLGQVRRFDDVLDPDALSHRLVELPQVWVVMVPGGWSHLLDAMAREPTASRLRRQPTATFNGGMQVVLLTHR